MSLTAPELEDVVDLVEDLWWIFYLTSATNADIRERLLGAFALRSLVPLEERIHPPECEITLHDPEADLRMRIIGDDDVSHLYLGVHAFHFKPPQSALARLHADKVCYQIAKPAYAFAENVNAYVERDDVARGRLTHVFWAQFFGPDFVHLCGSEILRDAPGWRNENTGDGGILYVLSASPFLYRGPRQFWQQARDYFSRHVANRIRWSDLAT